MNAPRKKPVGKPGKASVKIPPAKVKKPVAGSVAKPDATPAPLPEPFFYGGGEAFLWLEDAVKLERGEGDDYAAVRASVNKARELVIHVMRGELAQDTLPSRCRKPKESEVQFKRRMEKSAAMRRQKIALRIAKVTGSANNSFVRSEFDRARQNNDSKFIVAIGKALALKKRPKVIDYGKMKYLARFLVDYWCDVPLMNAPLHHHLPYPIGSYSLWFDLLKTDKLSGDFEWFDKDSQQWGGDAPLFDKSKPYYFLPPLAFMNENMRARFVADLLEKTSSDVDMKPHNITQWVNKLGLKTASKPTITGINLDGIRDGKKLIKLVVT